MIENKIREKIIKNSISLEKYGINDLAWFKEDAKKLICMIQKDKIGILGGDVYQLNSKLEALSDSWFCEPIILESEEVFFSRSKEESLKYIEKYPVKKGENILFSITFTEKIC